jgi:hypothetical protein
MNTSGGFDFDNLIEHELERSVGRLQGPNPAPAQSAYHAVATGGSMSLFSSLTAAASAKAAAGLATAALMVAGGAVVASAATGSIDPTVWGKTVTDAVSSCKDKLADGQHGIGSCVSAVAKQKGVQERTEHSASSARQNHPTGKPSDVPTGKPSDHPGGKPSGVPPGPPSTVPPAGEGTHPTGAPVEPPSPRP